MNLNLRLLAIIFAFFLFICTIYIVRKGKITIKYSMFWLFSAFCILIMGLAPNFLQIVANILGFELASNMIFGIILVMLLFINISLTIIVSGQQKKIVLLIQEVSLLKNKMEEKT